MRIELKGQKPTRHSILQPTKIDIPESPWESNLLQSYSKNHYRPIHKLFQILPSCRITTAFTYCHNKYQTHYIQPDTFHRLNNWYWHPSFDLSEEDWRWVYYKYGHMTLWNTFFKSSNIKSSTPIRCGTTFLGWLEFETKGPKPYFNIIHKKHHLDPYSYPRWTIYISTKTDFLPHLQQYHLLIPSLLFRYLHGYLLTDSIRYLNTTLSNTYQ